MTTKVVEERPDEEFKQLLASLPKHKGLVLNVYRFEGFWYMGHVLQAILHCRSHFRPIESDVLLVTGPKTGSTWLKSLVFSLFNRGGLAEDHPLTTKNPHELIPFLEIDTYADTNRVPDLSGMPSPRLFSTHIPACSLPSTTLLESGCRIVYLCRDPRDMVISLWKFSNKLIEALVGTKLPLEMEEVFDSFCNGTSDYGPFWDHILGYWQHSLQMPSRVLFLTYEEMKADTASSLRRLADFLGCSFSEGDDAELQRIIQICSFDHLKQLEINKTGMLPRGGIDNSCFFRRGEVGDWHNYLTPEMTLRLDTIINDKLRASGFNYY